MKLNQPEIIQILRRRMDLNQGTLGVRAFDTSFESGRTKIKNIELGRQKPTSSDLEKMAKVLKVPVAVLSPLKVTNETRQNETEQKSGQIYLKSETVKLFPGLTPYIEMLNKAVAINDEELIQHLSDKISQLFQQRSYTIATKPRMLASGEK